MNLSIISPILIITSFISVVLFILFLILYKKSKSQNKLILQESSLLTKQLDDVTHDTAKRIQLFARLSQILASSFSRVGLFNQMVKELSKYYPEYVIRIITRSENNKTLITAPEDAWDKNNEIDISFDKVIRIAMNSGKCIYSNWATILGGSILMSYIYPFPLLIEEKIKGYLIVTMKPVIMQDEHLFFSDIATLLSSVLQNVIVVNERDYINDQFGRSVDPRVRDFLLSSKEGGSVQSVSVMFFDIRNFTTLSEKLGPVKSVSLLNSLFSRCDEIIRSEGGFINKFTGDGFMAVFGAPIPSAEHENQAVRAAEAILKGLDISAGIGIASGEAMAGTIGSDMRKEYTVIGDTVNTASRVEGMCKIFGSSLVVSNATMKKCTGLNIIENARWLGRIKLKGKVEPIEIYDLSAEDSCRDQNFTDALQLYYNKNYTSALEKLRILNATYPNDKAIRWYINRAIMRQNDPNPWDGIEVMTEK